MPKSNVYFISYLEKTRAWGGTPLRAVDPPGPRRPHEGSRAAARLYLVHADSRDKLSCVDTCINNGVPSGIRICTQDRNQELQNEREARRPFGNIKENMKKT